MQARFLEKRNPWSRLLHFSPRLLLSRNPIEKVKKNSEKVTKQWCNHKIPRERQDSPQKEMRCFLLFICNQKPSVSFLTMRVFLNFLYSIFVSSSFVTRNHQFLSRLCTCSWLVLFINQDTSEHSLPIVLCL